MTGGNLMTDKIPEGMWLPDEAEPRPTVQLTGEDGNAFFIIGRVLRALRQAGASKAYIEQFREEAMSGDYDHVLQTVMKYAEVE